MRSDTKRGSCPPICAEGSHVLPTGIPRDPLNVVPAVGENVKLFPCRVNQIKYSITVRCGTMAGVCEGWARSCSGAIISCWLYLLLCPRWWPSCQQSHWSTDVNPLTSTCHRRLQDGLSISSLSSSAPCNSHGPQDSLALLNQLYSNSTGKWCNLKQHNYVYKNKVDVVLSLAYHLLQMLAFYL